MQQELYIGVDLGGTNSKVALVTAAGEILEKCSTPTNLPRPAEAICDDIAARCKALAQSRTVRGIGVGCPGTISGNRVLYSNNLDWHNFAMGDYLAQKIGLPVVLGNDANVAALGEALAGCAKGAESAVIVTLGTGVGSGVVLQGRLLTGYTGAGAELGHTVLCDAPDAPLCTCGRRGCFETYASATALIRITKATARQNPKSLLAQADVINGKTAFDAAAAGDAAAKEVCSRYIHYLAVGLANIINTFYPQVIGLSGGVANQGEKLLVPLREAVRPMIFGGDAASRGIQIVSCTLGYQAGMIGAALLAKQQK